MTRVFLLRHGQTDWNATGRLQGSTDIPLNETGVAQARAAARALGALVGARPTIVASPLSRALRTAQILAEALGGAPITADARLAERSYGVWEGLTHDERAAHSPHEVARWRGGDEPSIDGYESHAVLARRVLDALHEHAEAAMGDLVVVSHGGALRMAVTMAVGLRLEDASKPHTVRGLENAHWSQLTYRGPGDWMLVAHNVGSN